MAPGALRITSVVVLAMLCGGMTVWLQLRPNAELASLQVDPGVVERLVEVQERPLSRQPITFSPGADPAAEDPTAARHSPAMTAEVNERLRQAETFAAMGADLIDRAQFVRSMRDSKLALDVPARACLNQTMAENLHDVLARAAGGALRQLEAAAGHVVDGPGRPMHLAQQIFIAIVPDIAHLVATGRLSLHLRLSTGTPRVTILEGLMVMPEADGVVFKIDRPPWDVSFKVTRDIVPAALSEAFEELTRRPR